MNLASHSEISNFTAAIGRFLFRPRSQYWLARTYLCSASLVSVWIALNSPWNMQRQNLDLIGDGGWIVFGLLAFLAVIGIADTIVNDFLPEQYTMHWANEHRHHIYMAMALILLSMVYINLSKGSTSVLVVRYSLESLFCVLIAVFDTVSRYRKIQQLQAKRQG